MDLTLIIEYNRNVTSLGVAFLIETLSKISRLESIELNVGKNPLCPHDPSRLERPRPVRPCAGAEDGGDAEVA